MHTAWLAFVVAPDKGLFVFFCTNSTKTAMHHSYDNGKKKAQHQHQFWTLQMASINKIWNTKSCVWASSSTHTRAEAKDRRNLGQAEKLVRLQNVSFTARLFPLLLIQIFIDFHKHQRNRAIKYLKMRKTMDSEWKHFDDREWRWRVRVERERKKMNLIQ